MDFSKWNLIAKCEPRNLKKISELEIGQLYIIEDIKKYITKYGDKVAVNLEGNIYAYLPAKLSDALLKNEEAGVKEVQEELTKTGMYLRRLESHGRSNAVEFVSFSPEPSFDDQSIM